MLHRPVEPAAQFGQDVRVAILSYRSRPLWILGYPEAALADTRHALKDARVIGQAATLLFALVHASVTHIQCGNYAMVTTQSNEVFALANEKGSVQWKAIAIAVQGCVLALTGKASDAVQMITFGLTAFRSTGATLFGPWYLSYLARAYAELGQFDDA